MKAAFEKDVKQLVEGIPEAGTAGLIQIFHKAKGEFRDAIFRQAPDFKPFDQSTSLSSAHHITSSTFGEGYIGDEEALEPFGSKAPNTSIYLNEVLDMAQKLVTFLL